MCQLLGLSAAEPTSFSFSFRGFAQRGGCSDKHCDGWGIAFYEGRGIRTFIDPAPAAHSPIARLVEAYPVKTHNMMAHIRYATKGNGGALENVHPFNREMWGIQWCFAHNGDIPKFTTKADEDGLHHHMPAIGAAKRSESAIPAFNPIGDTDSEAVFCAILNALKAEFEELPTLPVLHETLQRLCCEIVDEYEESTIFNFLLGCGQYTLFAFSWPGSRPGSTVWNGLYYTLRKAPFNSASLVDCDYTMDFSKTNTQTDAVAVIATKPLTKDEEWIEMKKGELILFDKGVPYFVPLDCNEIENQGRGLSTKCKRIMRSNSISSYSEPLNIVESDKSSRYLSNPSEYVNAQPIIVRDVASATKLFKGEKECIVSRLVAFAHNLLE